MPCAVKAGDCRPEHHGVATPVTSKATVNTAKHTKSKTVRRRAKCSWTQSAGGTKNASQYPVVHHSLKDVIRTACSARAKPSVRAHIRL